MKRKVYNSLEKYKIYSIFVNVSQIFAFKDDIEIFLDIFQFLQVKYQNSNSQLHFSFLAPAREEKVKIV